MNIKLIDALSPEQKREMKSDWRKHLESNPGLDRMLDVTASPGCSNIPLIERVLHEVQVWANNWLKEHRIQ